MGYLVVLSSATWFIFNGKILLSWPQEMNTQKDEHTKNTERIILTDLRLHFRNLEVAESYARFYRDIFGQEQYKFRVIGLKK